MHGHENWAYFYVMEAQKWPFFQFFSTSWKIDWSNFFLVPTRKIFMIFEHNLPKFHQGLKNFYYIKFVTLSSNWKVKTHNCINKKLVAWIFVINIFGKVLKSLLLHPQIFFWLWRLGRLQSGREHFTWFWLYSTILVKKCSKNFANLEIKNFI